MVDGKCKDCEFAYASKDCTIPISHAICGRLSKKYNMTIIVPCNTEACQCFVKCD
jgi:hypothetical protein